MNDRSTAPYRPNMPIKIAGFLDSSNPPEFVTPVYTARRQYFLPLVDNSDNVIAFSPIEINKKIELAPCPGGVTYNPLGIGDPKNYAFAFSKEAIKVAPRYRLSSLLRTTVDLLPVDALVKLDILDFVGASDKEMDRALADAEQYFQEGGLTQASRWKVYELETHRRIKEAVRGNAKDPEVGIRTTNEKSSIDREVILSSFIEDAGICQEIHSLLLAVFFHLFDKNAVDVLYLYNGRGHHGWSAFNYSNAISFGDRLNEIDLAGDPIVTNSYKIIQPFRVQLSGRAFQESEKDSKIFTAYRRIIGRGNIYVAPLHGPSGDFGILLFVFKSSDGQERKGAREAKKDKSEDETMWHLMALHFHDHARKMISPPPNDGEVQLTPREREALLWTAKGKTAWEISVILGISDGTVVFHLKNAIRKLGVNNKQHAVIAAIMRDLINP